MSKFSRLSVAPYFSNVVYVSATFAQVKQLVLDFQANGKFYLLNSVFFIPTSDMDKPGVIGEYQMQSIPCL